MLLRLLVLLAGNLLRRHGFYLRCFSLSLFGRRWGGLGFLGVGRWVMAPERDFREAAVLLLILIAIFFGILRGSLGHHHRAEQQ